MSTTIIALSDSHCAGIRDLPSQLQQALHGADMIVHAGDHTERTLYDGLKGTADVVAVAGNMDSTALKVLLPLRQVFSAGAVMVGVVHGSGAPHGIAERVRAMFPENPDIIVFGHSHVRFDGVLEGTRMVNPGPAAYGYAVIRIGTGIDVELVTLENSRKL
jgi:putative phosphoesterase